MYYERNFSGGRGGGLLNKEQNVQVSDTTEV